MTIHFQEPDGAQESILFFKSCNMQKSDKQVKDGQLVFSKGDMHHPSKVYLYIYILGCFPSQQQCKVKVDRVHFIKICSNNPICDCYWVACASKNVSFELPLVKGARSPCRPIWRWQTYGRFACNSNAARNS